MKKNSKDYVRPYLRFLRLQRGLSDNTLDAYERDLQRWSAYEALSG